MRKILTDDVVKQYCLNELGFKNAASNKSIFNGYSKLASNNYAMTGPSQNRVEFYDSISQSPLINSVDLIQNLKRSDANVFVPEKYTRADNLQKMADLSESPEQTPLKTPGPATQSEFDEEEEYLNELETNQLNSRLNSLQKDIRLSPSPLSTPENQGESGPSERTVVNPLLQQALFNAAMQNQEDDDNDISGVEYMGVEMSPLSTRGQRESRGTQLYKNNM